MPSTASRRVTAMAENARAIPYSDQKTSGTPYDTPTCP